MPGVVVTTQTRTGQSSPLRAPSGQVFMVGQAERGSTTVPTLCRSLSDFENAFGARVSYGALYDQVKVFFDEGGLQAYVIRTVGPAATIGTLTLVDRAGTPLNTLRVDAASAGAWSSTLKIQVLDGSLAQTYRIKVTLNNVLVEDKTNLATPAEAVTAFQESKYIRVTNLGSATTPPDNIPAVLAATALSAGTDDRASITSTHYINSLNLFVKDLGDGAVCIPGQVANAIWTGIRDHCVTNDRIGLLSAAQSETKANLLTRAAEIDSQYCGLFAPWIRISDNAGSYRTVSPEGYVAACRARAHAQVGPWRAPAGAISRASTILGLDVTFNKTDSEDLNSGRVSVIRNIASTVRLYGWKSLAATLAQDYPLLKDRDLLNFLEVEGEKILEPYVFEPIDTRGRVLSSVNAALVGLVDPIAKAGGLYPLVNGVTGEVLDPGFKVDTSSTINPPSSLATNTINAILSVRIAPAAELVTLTIVKVGTTSGI